METKKILVVDDEYAIANLIKVGLVSQGHTVEMALSGSQALEKLKTFAPDVITLDIMMPDMNGFQVLEALISNDGYKNIPVIFISVIATDIHKKKALELGAYDILPKPINFDKLIKTIDALDDSFVRLKFPK